MRIPVTKKADPPETNRPSNFIVPDQAMKTKINETTNKANK